MTTGGAGASSFKPETARERILHHVVQHPGTWLLETARAVSLAPSVTFRLLGSLQTAGHVELLETGRRENFYFAKYTRWEQMFLLLANADGAAALLGHVAARGPVDNRTEITQTLGLTTQAMNNFTEAFIEIGVFARIPLPSGGRAIGYEVQWNLAAPQLRLLLCKLPPTAPVVPRLTHVLAQGPAHVED